MIPSTLVSHEAYSEVASRMSNTGIVVAVLSLEPLRLAHHQLGTDATAMPRLIQNFTTTLTTTTMNIPQQQQH